MAQWNGNESGILRKSVPIENHDELLVFGYACKLFRDDEKALFIDQGKHLIPWMGDASLKIDRYDCRGHLSDIRKYEASREGYDATRWLGLSDKERQLEELCDKERYYALEINEEEEQMYKDEEQKRQMTNAIGYSYDVPPEKKCEPEAPVVLGAEEKEEDYVPFPILDVPVDIEIPKTVKENARLEKTAMFVCNQGPQMEILIKAKQADNPQFSFLNQGDPLYKYYRHVLSAFKSGIYKGYEAIMNEKLDTSTDSQGGESSHYLHPSLLPATSQPAPPATVSVVPQVPYRPSASCAYFQLVNKIQGAGGVPQESAPQASPQPQHMTQEQLQYYQYYYSQQYHEYYKQMALYHQGQANNPGQFIPPADFQSLDPNIQAYIQQLTYNQYMQQFQQQTSSNSYAQIVSNVNKDNPYTANMPQIPQSVQQQQPEQEAVVGEPKRVVKKSLHSLAAAYGSGSESEDEDDGEDAEDGETEVEYKKPTGEMQVIIDKMASYVSKNGEQFEEIVKAKADPRFDFLNDSNEFNRYYREKIKEIKGEKTEEIAEKKNDDDDEKKKKEECETRIVKKEKKVIAPVCFSIKKPKDDPPKEIKSALPMEDSDEEEEENNAPTPPVNPAPPSLVASLKQIVENKKNERSSVSETKPTEIKNQEKSVVPETKQSDLKVEKPAVKQPDSKNIEKGRQEVPDQSKKPDVKKSDRATAEENGTNEMDKDKTIRKRSRSKEMSPKKNGILDGDDPILEVMELTGEDIEATSDRTAEGKLKDQLAAAKEKLNAVSRLQLERKRKAAAFLKLKSVETTLQSKQPSPERQRSPLRRSSSEVVHDAAEGNRCGDPGSNSEASRSESRSPSKREVEARISISDDSEVERERRKEKKKHKLKERSRSRDRDKAKKKKKEKEKRKKGHKRKHSKSKHDKSKKKLKKAHRRSSSVENSYSSDSS